MRGKCWLRAGCWCIRPALWSGRRTKASSTGISVTGNSQSPKYTGFRGATKETGSSRRYLLQRQTRRVGIPGADEGNVDPGADGDHGRRVGPEFQLREIARGQRE